MNTTINSAVIGAVRQSYLTNDMARTFFDAAATRKNDVSDTPIDTIAKMAGNISRPEAIVLSKQLADLHCGRFVVGRLGKKTRIEWAFNLRDLGLAAQSKGEVLHAPAENATTESDVKVEVKPLSLDPAVLADVKATLEKVLGVEAGKLEIMIKL